MNEKTQRIIKEINTLTPEELEFVIISTKRDIPLKTDSCANCDHDNSDGQLELYYHDGRIETLKTGWVCYQCIKDEDLEVCDTCRKVEDSSYICWSDTKECELCSDEV